MAAPKFIYVIEARNGVIKIGVSSWPESRVHTVNSHSPVPCRLVAVWPGDGRDEHALHRRFADHRSHCEWFRVEGAVAQFLNEVMGRGVDAVPSWESLSFPCRQERVLINRARLSEIAKSSWAHRKRLRPVRAA